jgi:hypothetical protein
VSRLRTTKAIRKKCAKKKKSQKKMAMRKDQVISSTCYICGDLFSDKVRLGVHIARCYEDAMDRGESWHPHPDILLDEVRYSQYMLSDAREKQFKNAEKKKVAFSTQDDFANLHSQLTHKSSTSAAVASSPKKTFALPSSSPPKPIQPSNIPTSTYQSDFNKNAKQQTPIDHVPLASGGVETATILPSSGNNTPRGSGTPRGSPKYTTSTSSLPPIITSSYSPSSSPSSNNNKPTPQFAVPGVNTLRSELASELDRVREFMQEEKRKSAQRDAVLASVVEAQQRGSQQPTTIHHHHTPQYHHSPPSRLNGNLAPAPVPTTTSASSNYNYSPAANATPSALKSASDNMMVTYPRPVLLDDRPKPSSARGGSSKPSGGNPNIVGYNFAEENKNQKVMETDIGQAIHGGGFEEKNAARVPCTRCGRFFAPDRVDAHEDVCVSKPKGIHRR